MKKRREEKEGSRGGHKWQLFFLIGSYVYESVPRRRQTETERGEEEEGDRERNTKVERTARARPRWKMLEIDDEMLILVEVGRGPRGDPPQRVGARVAIAASHFEDAGWESHRAVARLLPLTQSAHAGQHQHAPAVALAV